MTAAELWTGAVLATLILVCLWYVIAHDGYHEDE